MNSPESMNDEESKSGQNSENSLDIAESMELSGNNLVETSDWRENTSVEIPSDIEDWLDQIIKSWQQNKGTYILFSTLFL